MATLKEIQNVQLDILKTVAGLCDKHSIPYYLACGTFLGAVRHGGFIPWDDDVDIYMAYNDLKRFKEICKEELPSKYFYQDFETDPAANWIFTKIRANNTYMTEAGEENGKHMHYHQGIWIDIFPLLDAAKDEQGIIEQIECISRYQAAITRYEDLKKDSTKTFKQKLVTSFYNIRYSLCAKRNQRRFEKLQSTESDSVLIMSNAYWEEDPKKRLDRALNKQIKKEQLRQRSYAFEDTHFYGLEDSHRYLTQEYGNDYMTPKQWSHIEDYSGVILDTRKESV